MGAMIMINDLSISISDTFRRQLIQEVGHLRTDMMVPQFQTLLALQKSAFGRFLFGLIYAARLRLVTHLGGKVTDLGGISYKENLGI